ncbi:NAD-dependent epimerase/dehydratase family protein [Streptomyces stelliscabiei]|uniref:NAD-dependent epimerase/dehydratase family protein n=1 Tax=Streptomyces stelliscabiei TaxID=146820 RepID=UPI0029ADAF07|nr:NAD-dependent epimerase/dehydratase family protein [Streptomyces stelliscabiei]MDX2550105.1 NAD-dependent epimerase/dehydratase family protein [Streptomyces stelliscabiei]
MNILVTGAAGFIGTHLVRQLGMRGHRVTGTDKRHGRPTTDLPAFQRTVNAAEPDVIVHLGASCSTAVSLRDPASDFHDNALGTFNVAEAARQAGGIPVIYTSTVKVHPGTDGLIAPLGLSKAVGEGYIELYGDLYSLPFIINRPSTVYGPGQDGSAEAGWVTWFLRAALERQQITIHGDGTQSRDILHVDDFTALLIDQAEHFADYQGRTYEVGGGPDNEVSLLGLLERIGYSDVRHAERLPGDLQRVVTDNSPVSTVRGWEPAIGWQQGVARTYQWMERTR